MIKRSINIHCKNENGDFNSVNNGPDWEKHFWDSEC